MKLANRAQYTHGMHCGRPLLEASFWPTSRTWPTAMIRRGENTKTERRPLRTHQGVFVVEVETRTVRSSTDKKMVPHVWDFALQAVDRQPVPACACAPALPKQSQKSRRQIRKASRRRRQTDCELGNRLRMTERRLLVECGDKQYNKGNR